MPLTSRGKFLLLVAVFVVPVIAAWIAYFGWRPAAHSNYGTLLKVVPLAHTAGTSVAGTPFDLGALRGKWVMVNLGSGACDADCRRQLYLMRQTRIAQGKAQSRIERLWVLEDAGQPDTGLLAEHTGLHVWRPADAAFLAQFPAEGARASHIYLLDPLGNLMLRFPANPEPKRMMKDLKLLLKASQVG
ncbi:MAG: hypothetical protein B7Y26_01370 [Hydrogenophilales bacterium 16-64-46]|nr:MAG: hypothetical protein B7Z32_08745 [Hydrogenophilales bacterium 12-64-13]OYZ07267.1 MAG: hypothetical protein B7Y26_01370 [Hydrogenophilales bacterium 16-64-46]OZA37266.1 MAG: hypothetical protein B7X87_11115 [Hydrogenophilales bacterium 17-64-34]HQS98985.1 hypothetical protein [Thiobacillus sp.]